MVTVGYAVKEIKRHKCPVYVDTILALSGDPEPIQVVKKDILETLVLKIKLEDYGPTLIYTTTDGSVRSEDELKVGKK